MGENVVIGFDGTVMSQKDFLALSGDEKKYFLTGN